MQALPTFKRRTLITLVALTCALSFNSNGIADDDEKSDKSDKSKKEKGFETIELDESNLFFELNNTDGDLGIHSLIDGEPWKSLHITDPRNRVMLSISNRGRLRRQGLTEIFFESAEPTFDELSPEEFFERFPEGTYAINATSLEGDRLVGSDEISHVMPAAVEDILVSGVAIGEGCEDDPTVVSVADDLVISWAPVESSHPDLGAADPDIEIEAYQVVLEREEPTPLKYFIEVEADVTEVIVSAAQFSADDELKLEILARADSGNQTATESCLLAE